MKSDEEYADEENRWEPRHIRVLGPSCGIIALLGLGVAVLAIWVWRIAR